MKVAVLDFGGRTFGVPPLVATIGGSFGPRLLSSRGPGARGESRLEAVATLYEPRITAVKERPSNADSTFTPGS